MVQGRTGGRESIEMVPSSFGVVLAPPLNPLPMGWRGDFTRGILPLSARWGGGWGVGLDKGPARLLLRGNQRYVVAVTDGIDYVSAHPCVAGQMPPHRIVSGHGPAIDCRHLSSRECIRYREIRAGTGAQIDSSAGANITPSGGHCR